MIILPSDPEIVIDDEEIDVACTSSEHGDVAFDEKIQEETDGTIEIVKEKDAAEYILTPSWTNRAPKFPSVPKLFYGYDFRKIALELLEMMAENMIVQLW
ncbi:hypothetical protein AVEN_160392-1 [Araneus ventricosus]|uniref:Uncharacterized protein n=1 Tax=Araneus ventricosus TaxID=182803 RepID=A0A4Y2I9E2_ARAVE|nr:hypothetical protein AVEN_134458-1 [Araneus ventricosus]GBN50634.1 hypothetical protein AVEN_38256-1 [Araneus ventricosus]GBN50659.1 hypothetical protein AVEN_139422-1 [Araneus ventricosus]GBN50662.1 hypothetical protein AVEN_148734-1 [Araneus ventricosus]GBN50668.1 hypothetical protein AVEN_160392-1 [Araneus ventricosus]